MSSPVFTITDISEKSPGSGKFVVFIDAAPVGILGARAIADLGIRAGDSLDIRGMDRVRDAMAEQAVFEKGVELLAVRPRSARDLQRRLTQKGAGKSHVAAAIKRLTDLGYLNDAALADAVVRAKLVEAGDSRRRVQQELFRKGVARELADAAIDQAVEEHGTNERDAALGLAKKRLRSLMSFDVPTRRRRLYGFLARRGYDGELVSLVMRELGSELAEEGTDPAAEPLDDSEDTEA